jgi:LysM repeat protein
MEQHNISAVLCHQLRIRLYKESKSAKEKSVQYSYQDMLHAAPVKVKVPETSSAKSTVAKAIKEEAQAAKKIEASNPVTLEGPVEDQGIPYEEIMQNAKAYTKGINF